MKNSRGLLALVLDPLKGLNTLLLKQVVEVIALDSHSWTWTAGFLAPANSLSRKGLTQANTS